MKNTIINKMNERIREGKEAEDRYDIIGIEIKFQRVKKLLTQEALSKDICSLSYLCKIETCQIDPNLVYLHEICKRLDLSDDKIEALINSKDILNKVIIAYLDNNINDIDYCYDLIDGFENYRCQIINMIHAISHHDITKANKYHYNLLPITNSMREYDFIIFSLFSAILQYYNFRFSEAYEVLLGLGKFDLGFEMTIIKDLYLFKTSFAQNNRETPFYYSSLRFKLVDKGLLKLYDEVRYMICLYYLKNNCDSILEYELDSIINPYYRDTIKILIDFKNKNVSNIFKYSDNISTMAKLIRMYAKDKNKYIDTIKSIDYIYYIYDLDLIYLLSLAYKDDNDYDEHLFLDLIPKASYSDDNFIKDYLMNEIYRIYQDSNNCVRNKSIIRAHYLLYSADDNIFSNIDSLKEFVYENYDGEA